MIVRKTKSVDLGGPGERDGFTLEVTGCECRTADFEMEFRRFVSDWIKQANQHTAKREPRKPCGCKENA